MSAGGFEISKYELDNGSIAAIRVQPETIGLTDGTNANDPPAGDVNFPIAARARKGNREYGIGARSVTLSWTGAPPTNYENGNLPVPILTPARFAQYTIGTTVTYLGAQAIVVGRKAEQLR